MKSLLTTILIFSLFSLHAQRTVTYEELDEIDDVYYDKFTSERFTGIIQDTTSTTNDYMRIQIVDGVANGFFKGFYDEERTSLKWETQFVDGKKEGEYIAYFENGNVNFTANIKADNLDGVRRCYYDTGELMHIHHYQKGKEHGVTTTYYTSGQLIEKVHYKNGLTHGQFEKYHENGKLKQKATFKEDKLNGIFRQYDESGKLQVKQRYKNGEIGRAHV